MKKAIVIGALGFIGFNLCQRLLDEEYEVVGIDRYKKGTEKKIQEQKRSEIARNSYFQFIDADLENVNLSEHINKCDIIYYCLQDDQVNETNINQRIEFHKKLINKVLNFCHKKNVKFIFLSSYEVFNENEPYINKNTATSPRNLIGEIKFIEEQQILKYSQDSFSYLIVRLPTVYGPWQPESMTFQQLISGSSLLTIDSITEDVIFINDLIDALIVLSNNQFKDNIMLMGSNKPNQWQEGFNLLTGNKSRQQDPKSVISKIELSQNLQIVNHCMKTKIDEGIKNQKEHYTYLQKLKSLGLL